MPLASAEHKTKDVVFAAGTDHVANVTGMADDKSFLWRYVKTNVSHSFALWEVGESIHVLIGFLVAAALAALPLWGLTATFEPTIYQTDVLGFGLSLSYLWSPHIGFGESRPFRLRT